MTTRRLRVGDWVSFRYGPRRTLAQVAEARGPIGVNGRRLYRLRLEQEDNQPDFFEMPEDDLEFAEPPDKQRIIHYFLGGGLVEILRSNLGGSQTPRVWLTYSPRGDLTHTFDRDRGVVGGAAVPSFTLDERGVIAAKKEEIVGFLAAFGLTDSDAEEVLRHAKHPPARYQ